MYDIKYRPIKFSDVIGQDHVVQVLKARIKNGTSLNTSYIFAGGSGQGKTTLSRIFARAILCPNVDKETGEPCNQCPQCQAILEGNDSAFEERDAANGGTVEVVRSMLENIPYTPPFGAPCRIWLFDEAHRMSAGAQDALLKPIEDKKVVCIFCTTEGRKIVGPIYRRCEEYAIRRVTREAILTRAKFVLDSEKVEYQDEALLTVIDHAGGHVRDVLNRLETIAQTGPVTVDAVRESLNLGFVSNFYHILLNLGNDAQVVQYIEGMSEHMSPEDISAGIAEAAMNSFRLCNGMYADFAYTDKELAKQVYSRFGNTLLTITERLLKLRNVSKVSLLCSVLTLVQNGGVQEVNTQTPIIISVAPAVMASPTTPPSPSPLEQSSYTAPVTVAQGVPTPVTVPITTPPQTPVPQTPPPVKEVVLEKGVPTSYPKREDTPSVRLNFHKGDSGDITTEDKFIVAALWNSAFNRRWSKIPLKEKL